MRSVYLRIMIIERVVLDGVNEAERKRSSCAFSQPDEMGDLSLLGKKAR